MEDKKAKIKNEIEKTLEQFESVEKLTPDPYFYLKVQTRLENSSKNQNN